MTAIDRITEAAPMPTDPFRAAPHPTRLAGTDQFERMAKWLELFMSTARVAEVLARTAFVPEPMRGQPENIAAAMMKGLELGVDPLDALANMHVVKGKIGFSAEFMRRRILEAGHEFEFVESTDDRCRIKGRRAGAQEWQTVTFTADQARKAKIQLGDYPSDKLVARASSRLCKRVFPDVLAGANIIDDLDDEPDSPAGATVQRKRQPKRMVGRKVVEPQTADVQPAAQASEIDELLGEPGQGGGNDVSQGAEPSSGAHGVQSDSHDQDEPLLPLDEPITKPQLQKLSILRQQAGYPDTDEGRADWFQWVETQIIRRVGSNKDLTKAEASVLIDVLESASDTGQDGQ